MRHTPTTWAAAAILLTATALSASGGALAADVSDSPLVNGGVVGSLNLPFSVNGGAAEVWWAGTGVLSTAPFVVGAVLPVDGVDTVIGYCLDVDTGSDAGFPYTATVLATAFDEVNGPAAVAFPDQVRWILLNGYDGLNLAAFEAQLVAGGVVLHGGLSNNEAIAGTQAAIWHFAEGNVDVVAIAGMTDDQADGVAVAQWLVANSPASFAATSVSTPLALAPSTFSGQPGTTVGPWVVSYGGTGEVALSVDNPDAVLVDSLGGTLPATVPAGIEVYARIAVGAPDGSAVITATAEVVTRDAWGAIGALGTPGQGAQSQAFSFVRAAPGTAVGSVSWAAVTTTTAATTTTATAATTTTLLGSGGNVATTTTVAHVTLPATGSTSTMPWLLLAGLTTLGGGAMRYAGRRPRTK